MYRVICEASGDSADALDPDSALYAAHTLAHDFADALGTQGALRKARKSMLVFRVNDPEDFTNVTYLGQLTELARVGRSRRED